MLKPCSQCAHERHSPPGNIQNGKCPGGMPLISALARMMNHGVAAVTPFLTELTFCVSLFCDKVLFISFHFGSTRSDVRRDHFNVLK
jgi:hypothetical protein